MRVQHMTQFPIYCCLHVKCEAVKFVLLLIFVFKMETNTLNRIV